jgi:hypothetical protein
VRKYRRRYASVGVGGLELANDTGGEPALGALQLRSLETGSDSRLSMTVKQVCDFVRRAFAVSDTPNAITNRLKQLNHVCKQPK